ncbi:TrbG/VirB9 family P-type conjugative transfer protein [Lyticum sinuosum]|nr:TrbG/VirB9 family P-type conjugative transfer protein [Lyticum sinuosum]
MNKILYYFHLNLNNSFKIFKIVFYYIIIFLFLFFFNNYFDILNFFAKNDKIFAYDAPISTDSRIKTMIYSENEVFPIVLHYGYQTSIDFGKGEVIQTYSVGSTYAWQFSIVGRTMFIKPLEENIITNMTIITNKRRYYFELISKSFVSAMDSDVAYAIRFFYPDENETSKKSNKIKSDKLEVELKKFDIDQINPYNFNYKISGDKQLAPRLVFDDGNNTYFQYSTILGFIPTIKSHSSCSNLHVRQIGNYFMVNEVGGGFTISNNNKRALVVSNKSKY